MPDKLHLKFAGLQGRTLEAYGKALQHFLCYLTRERIRIRSVSNLDSHLSEYINILYQEGEALSVAGHLLSAIKRFIPEFKLRLPAASQFHRNWQRLHVPVRATPIPVELLEGLAALCLSIDEPALAILLILGFRCFLRTNEMLHLQWNHLLVLPGQQCINLILPFSKTSQGNPQVLRVEDPLVLQLLQRFRPAADCPAMLWPLSLRKFHRTWKQLLRCLGFSSTSFSPYGIRRGGPRTSFLPVGTSTPQWPGGAGLTPASPEFTSMTALWRSLRCGGPSLRRRLFANGPNGSITFTVRFARCEENGA